MSFYAGPVVVVIGPSGSGKSSVVRALCERGLFRVHPTWTTRPRRPDEADGSVEHQFVSDEEFRRLTAAGAFLDTVALFGLPHRYGLPPIQRSEDGRVDAVMLRAPLVERFSRLVPDVFVVQIEDDEDRVIARLRERGGSAEELKARLTDNKREVLAGRTLAHRVIRNDTTLEDLIERVAAVVVARVNQGWTALRDCDARQRTKKDFLWTALSIAGIVIVVVALLAGLALVAVFLIYMVALNSWANNK